VERLTDHRPSPGNRPLDFSHRSPGGLRGGGQTGTTLKTGGEVFFGPAHASSEENSHSRIGIIFESSLRAHVVSGQRGRLGPERRQPDATATRRLHRQARSSRVWLGLLAQHCKSLPVEKTRRQPRVRAGAAGGRGPLWRNRLAGRPHGSRRELS